MLAQLGTFVLGAILLLLGADSVARGVGGLALRGGASAFGVGLASTALGALVPALAVTIAAAWAGQPDLAFGSLIGGSIAQIGLVLGVCALVAPLRARLKLFSRANPALIAAAVLLWVLSLDGKIGRIDGVILVLAWLVVAALVVRDARGENEAVRNEIAAATGTAMLVWRDALRIVVGIVVLPFAAIWLVDGALAFARTCQVSPLVTGLTLLGAATAFASVPPTAIAARRGQGDFAIGHAFGAVLGSVLLLAGGLALSQTVGAALSLQHIEIPALIVLAVAIYPMMRSDGELSRREGVILVAAYALFLIGETWLAHGA
ncbi:MAG TPA: sodium:calcium antiporter [Rhodanobacteraceae bacterium]|nr:sodium:calcium antiporter [Rhodanobacteraceae bacterium]